MTKQSVPAVIPVRSCWRQLYFSLPPPPSISMHIVRYGHLEVVKYLIEIQGCSTGCTSDTGRTPLHYACWCVFSLQSYI